MTRNTTSSVRLTNEEKAEMEQAAMAHGMASVSEYIRFLHEQEKRRVQAQQPFAYARTDHPPHLYLATELGAMYLGDSLDYLHGVAEPQSVDLIMTSPPFGLVRKKSYGNEDATKYCDWFRPFAEGFKRVLSNNGSLVIDIGGAWKKGEPTRSLYHFELLIMLCRDYGFHLCQEYYWWNPAKLPSPAEWVNVRRIRVKDAVNCVWWLSPTPFPRTNNRRVLTPYSKSMLDLLKNGYKAMLRPSGHDISDKFSKNNGGAIPPNLLAIAHTESNSRYQSYCRENKLPIHPARFPSLLPEHFIRMLTEPGDLVVDPFAGSCITGAVSEALNRRWVCVEMDEQYLAGATSRFNPLQPLGSSSASDTFYEISAPCALAKVGAGFPLVADGGRTRPKAVTADSADTDAAEGPAVVTPVMDLPVQDALFEGEEIAALEN